MRELTIKEVFEPATGRYIQAGTYFANADDRRKDEIHVQRRELRRAKRKGQKVWVCALCQEPVYIAGGLGRTKRQAHFKHFVDSPRCPYQSRKNLSPEIIRRIKYNGAKESPLHREMKHTLANLLELDPAATPPDIEKTYFHQDGGREVRRPDVACTWNEIKVVFEIQISSDFVDVIVGREDFYREQGVFILWVFNTLDPDQYTAKDIYVGNQKNVFVFNQRVRQISRETGVLTFECHYKRPILINGQIEDEWRSKDVTMADLTFDDERMQVFWFDYDREEREIRKMHCLQDLEEYWCKQKSALDPDAEKAFNLIFEEKLHELFGIEKGWSSSKASKVLDALFSIRKGEVVNYDLNLYGLVDVMLNYRKPFTRVVLWALEIYGHHASFEDRPAFDKKVQQYKKGVHRQDPDYRQERKFDPLFATLFPDLAPKLKIKRSQGSC